MQYLVTPIGTDSGDSRSDGAGSRREDLLRRLCEASSIRHFKAGQHVFHAGDPQLDMYKIGSGCVCLYKNLADGRRQVLGFLLAGDVFGLELQQQHLCSAQTIVPSRLHCVPAPVARTLALESPKLMFELYQALANELAAAQDLALSIGRRDAEERLARFLVALSRHNERQGRDPATIDLPMPRSDIADYLGFTIETVSRTFRKLEKQRLIKLARRRSVQVLDMNGLQELMDGVRRRKSKRAP
jgi:CRP/FNR family transcriptional regulator